jgi:hypothetical protein
VSPLRCELGFYIPEDGNLHSHRRDHLKSYMVPAMVTLRITGFLFLSENCTAFSIIEICRCVGNWGEVTSAMP